MVEAASFFVGGVGVELFERYTHRPIIAKERKSR
jgi:hypothetical protein